MNEFAEFSLQTVMASIAAYLGVLATQPKFERIKTYNARIEKILNILDRVNTLAIQYWTTNGNNPQVEAEVASARTELVRLLAIIAQTKVNSFDVVSVRKQMKIYFQTITGGTFQQVSHIANGAVLSAADGQLSLIRDSLDRGTLSFNFKNIFGRQIP